ncbi:MAG: sodium:proline symporter [Gemmatimonadetes bacterium]|nr:sodium:proline symporter [Gemmatimonadota bacterium]
MIKILSISLGVSPVLAVGICFVITVAYSVAAGMWAVLWTDLIQFVIKMSAVIVLAIYSVRAVGGIAALKAGLVEHFGSETAALSVIPVQVGPDGIVAYAWMPLLTLAVFLSVQWWAAWYPGAEPGGGGYVAQRIFSARTEKDGVLATLFFQVAHYALRPWPWIVTGLCTVILYPDLQDREAGYVQAFVDLLPTPWRGFMLAGFAAAYMSSVATQLNWGASYLVNDFYKRFLKPAETEKHYVMVARLATVFLFLASIVVTWQLTSVERAWKLLLAMGAGTGLVLILRWYWWRINAWSEISSMVASLVVSVIAFRVVPPRFAAGDPNADAWIMLITVAVSTAVWLIVTFATRPEPDEVLISFYERVRPGGPGWTRIAERAGFGPEPIEGGWVAWSNWVAGIVAVYSTLFGIGKVIFGETLLGIALLALAAAAFLWIARSFRSEPTQPGPRAAGAASMARAA